MTAMIKYELNQDDLSLIEIAKAEFSKNLAHDWHGVAAAIRLQSGETVTAFVLEAENPSLTVCAEPMAIGKALDKLVTDPIDCIVAVRKAESTPHKVIPPCGRCREFITDYAPKAWIIVCDPFPDGLVKVVATDLLPFKYTNTPS